MSVMGARTGVLAWFGTVACVALLATAAKAEISEAERNQNAALQQSLMRELDRPGASASDRDLAREWLGRLQQCVASHQSGCERRSFVAANAEVAAQELRRCAEAGGPSSFARCRDQARDRANDRTRRFDDARASRDASAAAAQCGPGFIGGEDTYQRMSRLVGCNDRQVQAIIQRQNEQDANRPPPEQVPVPSTALRGGRSFTGLTSPSQCTWLPNGDEECFEQQSGGLCFRTLRRSGQRGVERPEPVDPARCAPAGAAPNGMAPPFGPLTGRVVAYVADNSDMAMVLRRIGHTARDAGPKPSGPRPTVSDLGPPSVSAPQVNVQIPTYTGPSLGDVLGGLGAAAGLGLGVLGAIAGQNVTVPSYRAPTTYAPSYRYVPRPPVSQSTITGLR